MIILWNKSKLKLSLLLFFSFFFFVTRCQSPWLSSVTSVSGAQNLNNPWVWYSHNIPPMIKMSNSYFTPRGTQVSDLGVMISRCSLDSQHGRADRHPANVGCSLFRYTNNDSMDPTNQRPKRKTWTREDNQLALHCYFKSNPTQRGYRKRMMEIWQELSIFQTTSQRLADQIRTIMKKGWFSELEIIEIHQEINDQERRNTLSDTPNINKQKQPIQNEPTSENGNPTQQNPTQQNNLVLTQEKKVILEYLKRILNSERTTLPLLRNIEWRIVKAETNKVNQVLTYIPTNNITDLNELIYAGEKLVCENIGIPSKNTKAKSKPGWEFRLETQIENLRKQLKVVKQKKNAEINRKEKTTQEKLTVQLEEIHQKVLAKEGRLKRYRQRVEQYRQNRTFQNNERKFYQQLGGDDKQTHQQPNAKETERFWTKIWQPKQHNEKAEWINHITRELEQLEEGPKAEIHTDLLRTTLKTVSNWKTPGHDGIHGFWFKKFPSIHDRLVLEM